MKLHCERHRYRVRHYVISYFGALLIGLAGCRAPETTLRGRVIAKDGAVGVPCGVEINSASEPFYAPIVMRVRTGETYEWVAGRASIRGVYVAARCDGYDVGMVSGLTLSPGVGTLERDVVVAKSATGGPSNNELQRTRPAQAMEPRR
jgi:hypothetical protein